MDGRGFDDVTRRLASGVSRRQMLRGLAGGAFGMLALGKTVKVAAGAEKVTICHKPGTPAERTLSVASSAVAAHLAHGDVEGPCAAPDPCADVVCSEVANGTSQCVEGQCQLTCNDGYEPDGTGGCAAVDPCAGVSCGEVANGSNVCVDGSCQLTCNDGYSPDGNGGCLEDSAACPAVIEVANSYSGSASLNSDAFEIPSGFKQTCITGPGETTSAGTCPVLTDCDGHRYWAYSDIENYSTMLIVKYAGDGSILASFDLPGDRYIYDIVLDNINEVVVFRGQSDAGVSLSYAALGLTVD
jgi:hypothetical protein